MSMMLPLLATSQPVVANAAIRLGDGLAAHCRSSAIFGILAFHAEQLPSSPAFCKDLPARSGLGPPVNFPFLWKGAWSILFRQRGHRPRANRLSPANSAFRAYLAAICRSAKAPNAPRALFPAPTTLIRDEKWPRHFLAAV